VQRYIDVQDKEAQIPFVVAVVNVATKTTLSFHVYLN
jgi:hypothetical protein